MENDKEHELLRFQIKTLQLMLSSVIDEDKYSFYMFIIDHNIPEHNVKLILNSLSVLKDRILTGNVSQDIKTFHGDTLSSLFIVNSLINKKCRLNISTCIFSHLILA